MEDKKNSEPLFPPVTDLNTIEVPAGVDRRAFLMKTAVVGAASVIVGCAPPAPAANECRGASGAGATGARRRTFRRT